MPEAPVIFLGPSLPLDEARALLPDAVFLPPVRRLALAGLSNDKPSAIGIIDGAFYQALSLSPKEVLPLLDGGVPVYGSSSIGALRAVELRKEGMKGVGRVYEMFVSGELDSDDEVAMTFCPDTLRPLSEPLVNLRIALAAAEQADILSARQRSRLVHRMRLLYFPDRTLPALFNEAAHLLSAPTCEEFRTWWKQSAPDTKAEDARLLLHQVAARSRQSI